MRSVSTETVLSVVGLAVGGGYYMGAAATTFFSYMALTYLPRVERIYNCGPSQVAFSLRLVDKPGQVGRIGSFLGTKNVSICDIKIEDMGKKELEISVVLDFPDKRIVPDVATGLGQVEGILSVKEE